MLTHIFKLFYRNDCPRCPAAKALMKEIQSAGYDVEEYDLDTASGLAESAYYGIVLSVPQIVLTGGDYKEATVVWRNHIPTLEEALVYVNSTLCNEEEK